MDSAGSLGLDNPFPMSESVAEVLLRKSKKDAGRHVKSLCDRLKELNSSDQQDVNSEELMERRQEIAEIFDYFLNPLKNPHISLTAVEWFRWLIASGDSVEEFTRNVREFDNAEMCGLVWSPNFVAYRCRTCGLSPCMSLCAECFLSGNHEGHDFNMFKSQAGGACDCGDTTVMDSQGFCPRHGKNAHLNKPSPPGNLMTVAEFMMPKLLYRLIFDFRELYGMSNQSSNPTVTLGPLVEESKLLEFLQSVVDMGAAARKIVAECLLDPNAYELTVNNKMSLDDENIPDRVLKNLNHYKVAVTNCIPICSQEDCDAYDCQELSPEVVHATFLEELMFWMVEFWYPQKLVTFMVGLFPHEQFKAAFADTFVLSCTRTAALLIQQQENDHMSNRVIHISVQLLSNRQLALELVTKRKLLRIIVVSFYNMIKNCLVPSAIHTSPPENQHLVANCGHAVMANHSYWGLVSDLHNLLSHQAIARIFLRDPVLVDLWCTTLSCFQGLNLNKRLLTEHVPFETKSYYAAFTAEIEIASATMWNLLEHCDQSTDDCMQYMLQSISTSILEWFDAVKFTVPTCWKPSPMQISFHIPLHRYYAAFLCRAVMAGVNVLFPAESILRQLAMHPLQIQVARSEIAANMWVRNGNPIKYQSFMYVQHHFCAEFVDLDLYLLQVCAARVNPDWFVLTLFERFHLVNFLSFNQAKPLKPFLRPEWETAMLEATLRLLASLVSNTLNLGTTDFDGARVEIAHLLCMSDKTHSQLLEQIPDKGNLRTKLDFEQILHELSDYRSPQFEPGGAMKQGTYTPKPSVWENDFDPLFVHLRALQPKDYQTAMDRYCSWAEKNPRVEKGKLWPPYRVPGKISHVYEPLYRVLHSRSTLGIIYVLLFKSLNDLAPVSEEALGLCIYLLHLALHLGQQTMSVNKVTSRHRTVLDLQFCAWFPGNCLYTNLSHKIDRILVVNDLPGLSRSVEDETDGDFPDLIRLRGKFKGGVPSTPGASSSGDMVVATIPMSRSSDIPFIDGEFDDEMEVDFYYSRVVSCLPAAMRREYLLSPPVRPALTYSTSLEEESSVPYVTEAVSPDPDSSGKSVWEKIWDQSQLSSPTASAAQSDYDLSQHQFVEHPETSSEDEQMEVWYPEEFGGESSATPVPLAIESSADVDIAGSSAAEAPVDSGEASGSQQQMLPKRPSSLVRSMGLKIRNVMAKAELVRLKKQLLLKSKEQGKLPKSRDPLKALPSPKVETTETSGESIISLLIKLYLKLGRKNYCPPVNMEAVLENTSRVGDGPYFIQQILDKVYVTDTQCRKEVDRVVAALEPQHTETEKKVDKKASMRQAAKELQSRLMMQFAQQQKAVSKHLQAEMEESVEDDSATKFECVICSQNAGASLDHPIGLIVLAQATNVCAKISPNEKEKGESLLHHFDHPSTYITAPKSLSGTICVQTCGHHIHTDCHSSYMQAMKRDRRELTSLAIQIDKGEFNCPLCRQVANGVLPIVPPSWTQTDFLLALEETHQQRVSLIHSLLETEPNIVGTEMAKVCEEFTLKLTQLVYPPSQDQMIPLESFAIFLSSLVRSNLELYGMWKDLKFKPKRSCLGHLINFVSMELGELPPIEPGNHALIWSRLTGSRRDVQTESVSICDSDLPVLLMDASSLLILFSVLVVRHRRSEELLATVFNVTWNLRLLQAALSVTLHGGISESRVQTTVSSNEDVKTLTGMLTCLNRWHRRIGVDEPMSESGAIKQKSIEALTSCLPFLNIAAWLKAVMVGATEIPDVLGQSRLETLKNFCLDSCRSEGENLSEELMEVWLEELVRGVRGKDSLKELIPLPRGPLYPKLIDLPQRYDMFFRQWSQTECAKCGKIPRDALVCLVCGKLNCYKGSCCSVEKLTELEMHSVECGSGTGVYQWVQTSMIMVVRGSRISNWGSLFLDMYGEEDLGLKRGKPLYLSQDRFDLLQQQWLSHSFDWSCRNWSWISQTPPVSNVIVL